MTYGLLPAAIEQTLGDFFPNRVRATKPDCVRFPNATIRKHRRHSTRNTSRERMVVRRVDRRSQQTPGSRPAIKIGACE